jgi:3-oxoadipate enol-lactonase
MSTGDPRRGAAAARAPVASMMHVVDRGRGRVLVLGHGIALDQTIFDAPRAALAERCRVITWDAPGHGGSPPRNGPWRHDLLADDLAAELRRRGVERAVVGGLSQGGWIALNVALRHPELVEGLVLLSCTAGPHPQAGVGAEREAVRRWAAEGCDPAYARYCAEQNFGSRHPAAGYWRARHLAEDGGRYVEAYEAMLTRPDLLPRLGKIAAPALIVRGEHDPWVAVDEVEEMADALPAATLLTLPGAWHTLTVTHPEASSRAIETFLSALPPST